MASQKRIGAIIGIDGAKEYTQNLSLIVRATKELKSELGAVTSSFTENSRTIEDTNNQRKTLTKIIENLNEKLKEQQYILGKIKENVDNAEVSDEEYVKVHSELQEAINKTNTEINKHKQQLEDLPSTLEIVKNAYKNAKGPLIELGEVFKDVGGFMTKYITTPIVAGGTAGVKVAKDFESAFAGVKKTVDETETTTYDDLAKSAWDIAQSTASSVEEVAAVMEVAGQLGVGADELEEFSRAMIQMGDSTNLVASDAASEIATILNITRKGAPISSKYARQLGNAIVYLGNNFNTTEADITHMAERLAAGGTIAGLTEADILGLATAMSSVGINAEAGGSSMSTTLSKIQKEVAHFKTGAESNLGYIAEISGTTAEEFAEKWMTEPIEAIKMFIRGLGELDGASGETVIALDELGMANIRESNMLKALALAADILDDAIQGSNEAFTTGNDLADEASKRYETFDSKLSQLKETAKELGTAIGEDLIDVIEPSLEKLKDFIDRVTDGWNNMSEPAKQFVGALAGIMTGVGPALLVGGNLLIWLGKLSGALNALTGGTVGGGVLGTFGKGLEGINTVAGSVANGTGIGTLLGKFGLLTGALSLINYGFITAATTSEEEANKIKETWDTNIDNIVGKMTGMPVYFDATQKDISEITGSLADNVTANYERINDNATRYSQETRRYVTQMTDEMGLDVTGSLSRTKENLTTTTGEIKSVMSSDFYEVENMMIDAIQKGKEGIQRETPEVNREIHKMVQTGVDDITWLRDDMFGYGTDMMSNLASGISSGASWVVDKIKSLASNIWSYLHFSEPEKGPLSNFNTWMPDMMKQMAQGINDNSYLVEDAIGNVASRMSLGSENNSFNYGGVVINLNVPDGTNGQMLVDEIETELANRTMRRRAVFG